MSDQEKQFNKDDLDLKEVRLLIGEADGGDIALDDILAEFGSDTPQVRPIENPDSDPSDLPWPEAPRTPRTADNVVQFPGTPQPEEEPEENAEEAGEEADEEQETPEEEPSEENSRVIAFPQQEKGLSAFLKKLSRKADDYADRMFVKDAGEVKARRLEKLIPGTDTEQAAEPTILPRAPKIKHREPLPEDKPLRELSRAYGKALKGMGFRSAMLALVTILAVVQMMIPTAWLPGVLVHPILRAAVPSGLLLIGVFLSLDLFREIGERLKQGKVSVDTVTMLAGVFTLADGLWLVVFPSPSGRLPSAAAALLCLWMLQYGTYHKRCAQRLSCRTAVASSEPYRVTLDAGKWNGRYTFTKWAGSAERFGSQIQVADGAEQTFGRLYPLILVGDVVLALLATLATRRPGNLIWGLSALFTITSAAGGAVAYGRAFHKVARRLAQSGAALAGWPGVVEAGEGSGVLITDTDLFPPGYVEMNGIKVLGDFPMERVVAYTATMIRASGSGLTKLFQDQLRTLGGMMRNADNLCCYEGGGLSANIRGEQVLVGSAAFMNLMEIPLPVGLNVKNAVFCAIDGELAGIFALSYNLPDTVFPCMEELMREKISPVLATRDFNLIPSMLQQRFKLAAEKMDFPPVERRRELSDPNQPHNEVLTALLCREGLHPFAEAITAAKRLRWATKVSTVLCCAASVVGMLLGAYLVALAAYGSLSALNLFVYLLAWLVPVWLLSSWVHRF